ncbi:MAG: acetylxylan esterase [Phycisphaeraceae bacterium]|nr:acetylxylan esterase [Phycisphaeraceae bacterium]
MSSSVEARRAELERLRKALPANEAFEKWLAETGNLPPDFAKLAARPRVQDPLVVERDGRSRKVTAAEWPARRMELQKLVEDWLLGHAPPAEAAGNLRAVTQKVRRRRGAEARYVMLEFGPDYQAKLPCVLVLPEKAKRPLPVFVCQVVSYRLWMRRPLSENFAYCYTASGDDCPDMGAVPADWSRKFAKLFGDYDWSAFRRRGWAASRVMDWLVTLPEVDSKRIYIGGHSRSGKQALTAAAFDERFAGVIASSPGSGGSMPYRYCDQAVFGEAVEILTQVFPEWVHLGVRFFAGREHLLPADSHYLYALIAPRPVLMSTGIYDWVESTWAVEQVYQLTQPIYQMLGKPENLALRYRPHQHGWVRETCEAFTQFLTDVASGKAPGQRWRFAETAFHDWEYAEWAKKNPAQEPPRKDAPLQERLRWLLGEGPEFAAKAVKVGEGESDFQEKINVRNWPAPPQRVRCRFGEGVNGQLYFPTKTANGDAGLRGEPAKEGVRGLTPSPLPSPSGRERGSEVAGAGKLPGIVWLGPWACSNGYTGSYRCGDIAHMRLLKSGAALVAFDPLGTGARQMERRGFYERNPKWSLMGKMVADARHAVDVLLATPEVNPRRIYLVGYALGGMTAILAGAMDQRVAGVVSVAGFTPFRGDGPNSPTGGVWRWSHLYGWLPQLGAFAEGKEAEIPVDFGEIVGSLAPRPVLVVAPKMDRHAVLADVTAAVEEARRAYAKCGAAEKLTLHTPAEWNRLTDDIQDDVVAWIKGQGE